MAGTTKMDACEVIEKAIPILEENWGKGSYYNYTTGAFCAVGALRQASGFFTYGPNILSAQNNDALEVFSEAFEIVSRSLFQGTAGTKNDIVLFNDAPSTTKEDIINIFKSALADCS